MHSGILPLNKERMELLVPKHREPREPSPDILIQGPTRPIHVLAYDDMNESVITKASMLTKGGSGSSGLDTDGWRRILTFRAFGTAILDLRQTFVQLVVCRRAGVTIILGVICGFQTNSTGQKIWAKTNRCTGGTMENSW